MSMMLCMLKLQDLKTLGQTTNQIFLSEIKINVLKTLLNTLSECFA